MVLMVLVLEVLTIEAEISPEGETEKDLEKRILVEEIEMTILILEEKMIVKKIPKGKEVVL